MNWACNVLAGFSSCYGERDATRGEVGPTYGDAEQRHSKLMTGMDAAMARRSYSDRGKF